jgi:hypothetical protein
LEVGLVTDKERIKTEKTARGEENGGTEPARERGVYGKSGEIEGPEGIGEEVAGEGLDINYVVCPDEIEQGVLGYDEAATADKLFGQRGDVCTGLFGDEPEVRGEDVEVRGS